MSPADWTGVIGGSLGILITISALIRAWNRREFDADQVMKDIKELQDANLANRVKSVEISQLEIKSHMHGNNDVLLSKLDDMNKTMMEMNRSLGRLEGKAGHE